MVIDLPGGYFSTEANPDEGKSLRRSAKRPLRIDYLRPCAERILTDFGPRGASEEHSRVVLSRRIRLTGKGNWFIAITKTFFAALLVSNV